MKPYLSIYYGIEESLPDEEFYKKIYEINRLAEEYVKKFEVKNYDNRNNSNMVLKSL